jgi:hypothetical protein
LKQVAYLEMIRVLKEDEPSKPSARLSTNAALRRTEPRKLVALLRGELDWVVMKCLEKSREHRYETANGLAREVQRYLADEAVEARPPSVTYRLGKFLKRHKGPVVAATLLLLALVAGMAGTTLGLIRADKARAAEAERAEGERGAKVEAEARRAEAEKQKSRAEATEKLAAEALAQSSLTLLQRSAYADAEALLHECLTIRAKTQPDFWTTFHTQSLLGGALLGQKKYAEAEPLLLAGYDGMKQREVQIPPQGKFRLTEAVERLVQLYEATDRKDEAAKWKKIQEEVKEAEKPAPLP